MAAASHAETRPRAWRLVVSVGWAGVGGGFVGYQGLVDAAGFLDANFQFASQVAGRYLAIVIVEDLPCLRQQAFFGIFLAGELFDLGLVLGRGLRLALGSPRAARAVVFVLLFGGALRAHPDA